MRAFIATTRARRLLKRPKRGKGPDPLTPVLSEGERDALLALTIAMTAGFVGWVVCAMFASVAYNWTFYYLIALIVSTRELVLVRVAAGLAAWRGLEKSPGAGTAKFFRRTAPRFA